MSLRLVDVHCHLQHEKYDGRLDGIIEQAKRKMDFLIVSGANVSWNRGAIELSARHPDFIYATAGIHPAECKNISDSEFLSEIEYIKENADRIVAIGETGLDHFWDTDDDILQMQRRRFEELIELSRSLNLPLVVHSRKAEDAVVSILEENDTNNVIMHCFSGSKKIMERCIGLGYYISFSTMILASKLHKKLAKSCPVENILLETDAPYLAPSGTTNFPWNVELSIKKISEIKNMDVTGLLNQIYGNSLSAFNIGK
ncbi:MAG: TatD family hydrolase [Methanocellales archaeon]|nr:TatD family hydrolase [Methanocellales archaeon]